MRSDKKSPLKSDKKVPPKVQKKGSIGFNKKSALLEDAITQMNAGKYGRASSALKDLLALDPLNAEARRLFATLHLRLGSLMSARTAFESLAREAMERQDYWLAESLLREYLTAGPRYVPFLEMLGRVYEEKGDVMAAVAEYGKAVEVLLEDPDTDHPNRASDLFVRIRSLAPGSPVAFRFAAMFDTVTGQVLQVTPQPPVVDSINETAHAPALIETPPVTDSAVVMPWEQMETASSDVPRQQEIQVSAVEQSPEVIAFTTTSSTLEAVTEDLLQAKPEESLSVTLPVDSPQESEVQPQSESSVSAVTSAVESVQAAGESDPPVLEVDPASIESAEIASASVAEVFTPTMDASAKTGPDSVATLSAHSAPMPWDQVEEAAGIIPPQPEGPAATPADIAPPPSGEVGLTPSVAESPAPSIEVLTQSSGHPIATAPASPAPMPWDQIEEVAVVIPSPPSSPEPVIVDAESLPPTQSEVSTLPLAELAPFQPVEPEPPAAAAPMPFEEMDLEAPVLRRRSSLLRQTRRPRSVRPRSRFLHRVLRNSPHRDSHGRKFLRLWRPCKRLLRPLRRFRMVSRSLRPMLRYRSRRLALSRLRQLRQRKSHPCSRRRSRTFRLIRPVQPQPCRRPCHGNRLKWTMSRFRARSLSQNLARPLPRVSWQYRTPRWRGLQRQT